MTRQHVIGGCFGFLAPGRMIANVVCERGRVVLARPLQRAVHGAECPETGDGFMEMLLTLAVC